MSEQQLPADPEPGRQDVARTAESPGEEVATNQYGVPLAPRRLDKSERRTMIVRGSLLAGRRFGGGLIIVVHAIAQANPAAFGGGSAAW